MLNWTAEHTVTVRRTGVTDAAYSCFCGVQLFPVSVPRCIRNWIRRRLDWSPPRVQLYARVLLKDGALLKQSYPNRKILQNKQTCALWSWKLQWHNTSLCVQPQNKHSLCLDAVPPYFIPVHAKVWPIFARPLRGQFFRGGLVLWGSVSHGCCSNPHTKHSLHSHIFIGPSPEMDDSFFFI